jgi:hypothetical protein
MSATKELLEGRGADYVAALVDHADEMIERLEKTNAELLAALELLMHEVKASGNGTAPDYGWPKAVAAARDAIANARGVAK